MSKVDAGQSSPVSVSPRPQRSSACACALLGCGCLGLLLIPVSIGLGVYFFWPQLYDFFFQSIRSVTPYRMTIEVLEKDAEIGRRLGAPLEDEAPMQFRYQEKNQTGSAYFVFRIKGPQGSGEVMSFAEKSDGIWRLTRVVVEIDGTAVDVVGQGAVGPPPEPPGDDEADLF